MTITLSSCGALSDADLLATVKELAAGERHATARLIASLIELDTRRLYLGEGCSSLFTYCTQVLHLSEHAAYGRIEAARAARRFPVILDRLADSSLTLTAVCLLAPHLTADNHRETLAAAAYKSKREVEHLVAALHPQPPVATSIRKLPSPSSPAMPPLQAEVRTHTAEHQASDSCASTSAPPTTATRRPAIVVPVAPEQYKVQIAVGAETVAKLRKAQQLMRHTIPTGDLAAILDRALTMLLAHLERTKAATVTQPKTTPGRPVAPGSRHIPAAVRRDVWARDEGRCAFVGTTGRCTETAFLEFHHVVPYAAGGEATVETIALRCRAHNLYEAELDFGPGPQDARAVRKGRPSEPSLLRESRERFGTSRRESAESNGLAWDFHVRPPTAIGNQLGPDRVQVRDDHVRW